MSTRSCIEVCTPIFTLLALTTRRPSPIPAARVWVGCLDPGLSRVVSAAAEKQPVARLFRHVEQALWAGAADNQCGAQASGHHGAAVCGRVHRLPGRGQTHEMRAGAVAHHGHTICSETVPRGVPEKVIPGAAKVLCAFRIGACRHQSVTAGGGDKAQIREPFGLPPQVRLLTRFPPAGMYQEYGWPCARGSIRYDHVQQRPESRK